MSSVHFLPGLKEIKALQLYAVNGDFPGEVYDRFPQAVEIEQYVFPQSDGIAELIVQVAAEVYDGRLPIKKPEIETVEDFISDLDNEPAVRTIEDHLINNIAKLISELPSYLVTALAEAEHWTFELLDRNYHAWASQNAYNPGERYLRATLKEIDLTEDGLEITGNAWLHHLRATSSIDIDNYSDELWETDILLDKSNDFQLDDLTKKVQDDNLVASRSLHVQVLKNGILYPTEQLVYLLPSLYRFVTRVGDLKDDSHFEQLRVVSRFLNACYLADTEEAMIFEELGPEEFEEALEEEIPPETDEEKPIGDLIHLRKP
jgi:hypothetical protein